MLLGAHNPLRLWQTIPFTDANVLLKLDTLCELTPLHAGLTSTESQQGESSLTQPATDVKVSGRRTRSALPDALLSVSTWHLQFSWECQEVLRVVHVTKTMEIDLEPVNNFDAVTLPTSVASQVMGTSMGQHHVSLSLLI